MSSYERLKTYFQDRAQEVCAILGLFPSLGNCRGSRVRGRGSRAGSRGSRVRSRGSQVEGRMSRVEGRKSRVEGHRSTGRGWESRGRQSKVNGQNLSVCMFLIILKNEVFWSVLVG